MSSVYWIHHPEHTDMFSQGYIGVSKDAIKRCKHHGKQPGNIHLANAIKKYGWDTLIKEVILIADNAYCLMIEQKLRSVDALGWNIIKGGGMPPLNRWNLGKHLSEETKAKISKSRTGKKHTPEMQKKITDNNLLIAGIPTRFVKGFTPWNKGVPMKEEHKLRYKVMCVCPHCGKEGKIAGMRVWHMNNCKFKENNLG